MKQPVAEVVLTAALAIAVLGCGGGGGGSSRTASGSPGPRQPAGAPSTTAGRSQPDTTEANVSGDIPDNQVFVAFTNPIGGFTVKVPEGWARSDADGAVLFSDKLNSIRLETRPAAAPPSVTSAQATEVPAIRTAATGFQPGKVTSVARRKAGPAVLVTYRADAAPDPVTGKVVHDDVERYYFWKSGTEAILTLSGPAGSDNVDPWRTVTDSFSWV